MSVLNKWKQHELSKIFPPMSAEEKKALIDDIRANGLLQKIHTYEGKIIDGWHRYQACLEAEVRPVLEPMPWKDPVKFVMSANLYRNRKPLTEQQSDFIELQTWTWSFAKQIKETSKK